MAEVVSVKFKDNGRSYFFKPESPLNVGDSVIVETANGIAFGTVSKANHEVDDKDVVQPLKSVLRVANEQDLKRLEQNRKKEQDAFSVCLKKIENHKLDMKLVEVEYSFDSSKITFFFTSDGRIDFRELVKDLASHFHTRIELRQIGVRDEARMLGGLGICGQPFCCKQFLDDFQPVSIKMAKEQGLSLNPTKISGTCGRLMCCLKYEQSTYEEMLKFVPRVDAIVDTKDGKGTVIENNVLAGLVKVRIERGDDSIVNVYDAKDVVILKAASVKLTAEELKELKKLEE